MLQKWAMGDFTSDYVPDQKPVQRLEDLPVIDQPDMLIRASMEFCLADAFHPGCEMTWPLRTQSMYMAPFRLKHQPSNWVEPSFGAELTSDTLSLPDGPLAGQIPGGITRWMAIPWQTDTASCRSGYQKSYDPYVPTFWPARVPNEVLTEKSYRIVMDTSRSLEERMEAFAMRASWLRLLGSRSYTDQINNMIDDFGAMGVIELRDGPGHAAFPETMQVEMRPKKRPKTLTALEAADVAEGDEPEYDAGNIDVTGIEKVRRFPRGVRTDDA